VSSSSAIEGAARRRVLILYGTRPEAIKMAPVVAALRGRPESLAVTVCTTGQHRGMLDQVHALFGLRPDADLDLMRPDQHPNELAGRSFAPLDALLRELAPDWMLVQGDTTTALVGALAAFHRRVRVGHVEAGLRTGDLDSPFPEEANRRIIDLLAGALFAPTARARQNLLAEGLPAERIHVTGNTGIDALHMAAASLPRDSPAAEVLVTVHRRESFGEPLERIFAALRALAARFPEVRWVLPVHPNPRVASVARERLAGLANVELHEPFDYPEMIRRMRRARLVLTDSGGVQEEAPAFGTPVLVLRDKTERPEGVAAGVARLVGTDPRRIVTEAVRLLTDPAAHAAMATPANPYGDGAAAARIAGFLADGSYVPFVPAAAAAGGAPGTS
jgi:UDP-N-acetylglucosamine 2-epimerase (non-hydrolysing)